MLLNGSAFSPRLVMATLGPFGHDVTPAGRISRVGFCKPIISRSSSAPVCTGPYRSPGSALPTCHVAIIIIIIFPLYGDHSLEPPLLQRLLARLCASGKIIQKKKMGKKKEKKGRKGRRRKRKRSVLMISLVDGIQEANKTYFGPKLM
ncbi:Serine/Threonine-Protein Kinase Sgk1 [Manis pentadactyla]|nr:Serine/Threonine-Protein Kinase Sgk1 [Manis pentadactyla]